MTGTSSFESNRGTPSGNRENMTGPQAPQAAANRLHEVDLASRGESVEDELRDRGSNGSGRYDDSLARRNGEGEDRLGTSRGD